MTILSRRPRRSTGRDAARMPDRPGIAGSVDIAAQTDSAALTAPLSDVAPPGGLTVTSSPDGRTLLSLLARAEDAYRRYRTLVVDRAAPGRPLNIEQRQALREHELAEQALAEYRRRNYG